jgi:dihydrofolate reductase
MKQQPGKDMIIWGGVSIVASFMQLRLIDEYRICIAPVVIGNGMKPRIRSYEELNLKLLDTTTFNNGVVLLNYVPA